MQRIYTYHSHEYNLIAVAVSFINFPCQPVSHPLYLQFSYHHHSSMGGGNYFKERLHFAKDSNDNFTPINGKSNSSFRECVFKSQMASFSPFPGYIPSITNAAGSSLDCLSLIVQSINCSASPSTTAAASGGTGIRTGSLSDSQTASSLSSTSSSLSSTCQFRSNNIHTQSTYTTPSPT